MKKWICRLVLMLYFVGIVPSYQWLKAHHMVQYPTLPWTNGDRVHCCFFAVAWPETVPLTLLLYSDWNKQPAEW